MKGNSLEDHLDKEATMTDRHRIGRTLWVIILLPAVLVSGCQTHRENDLRSRCLDALAKTGSTGVEVTTDGGVVTLHGVVDTADDASELVAAVSAVSGVERVVSELQPMDAGAAAENVATVGAASPLEMKLVGERLTLTGAVDEEVRRALLTALLEDGAVTDVSDRTSTPGVAVDPRHVTSLAGAVRVLASTAEAAEMRFDGEALEIDATLPEDALTETVETLVRAAAPSLSIRLRADRALTDEVLPDQWSSEAGSQEEAIEPEEPGTPTIAFARGAATLLPESEVVLDELRDTLRKSPELHVVLVVGFEPAFDPDREHALRNARIQELTRALIEGGLERDRVRIPATDDLERSVVEGSRVVDDRFLVPLLVGP